jgi:hypothetical protein
MHVGHESSVKTIWAHGIVQESVNVQRVALARLVGHLRNGLVYVDQFTVSIGEAHRHSRAGENSRDIIDPGWRPIVIIRVQPYSILQFHQGLAVIVRPGDAVHPMCAGRGRAGELRRERS